jgi:iron complex outermembrane receptor protein
VRAANDRRPEIDDYTLVDLTLRRGHLFKNLEVAASLRNLFDEEAREPSSGIISDDYSLAGRSVWVELSFRM